MSIQQITAPDFSAKVILCSYSFALLRAWSQIYSAVVLFLPSFTLPALALMSESYLLTSITAMIFLSFKPCNNFSVISGIKKKQFNGGNYWGKIDSQIQESGVELKKQRMDCKIVRKCNIKIERENFSMLWWKRGGVQRNSRDE